MGHIQVESGALTAATPGLEVLRQAMMGSMMNFFKLLVQFAVLTQSAAQKGAEATAASGLKEADATWQQAIGHFAGAGASVVSMGLGSGKSFFHQGQSNALGTQITKLNTFSDDILQKPVLTGAGINAPAAGVGAPVMLPGPAASGTPVLAAQPVAAPALKLGGAARAAAASPAEAEATAGGPPPNDFAKAILRGDPEAFKNPPTEADRTAAVKYFQINSEKRTQAQETLKGIKGQIAMKQEAKNVLANSWTQHASNQALQQAASASTAINQRSDTVDRSLLSAQGQMQQATTQVLGASTQAAEKALEAAQSSTASVSQTLQSIAAASARA
jgi:hypothetical protein